jgi:hypothetical protein
MACDFATGIGLDTCRGAIGGIKRVFIGKLSDFQSGVVVDGATEEVTDLPTATIYQFDFQKNTGEFEDSQKIGAEGSGVSSEQTVKFQFAKLSAAKRKLINSLVKNRLVIFVQTSQNKIWMCGASEGCDFTTGSGAAGKAKTDFEGYKLEFMATEPEMARMLSQYTADPFDNFEGITVSATQIND